MYSKTHIISLVLILVLLGFNISTFAEGLQEFKGKVLEKGTENPLPGVAVFVSELNRGTVTNEKGEFRITSLPDTPLTFEFSLVGYQSIIEKFKVGNFSSGLTIRMEETTTTIDEVVVSGAYVMSRENSPIAIDKINRDDILKMPAPSLMSSLAKTPGVNEVSLGPGISKPVIRGLSFSRVLSVYQGARFENQQWGADHGLGLNETGISSVEIIKGPASIIYGSGAMAGVIHLIEDRDAVNGQVEGDVNLRTYSNTLGLRGEAGIKGATDEGLTWSLRGAMESHGDYHDGDGNPIGNSRFTTKNFKSSVGVQKKWGDTKLRYTYLNQRLGLIEEDDPESLATDRLDRTLQLPFQEVQDHFINSETNVFVGNDRLKVTLGYHWNIREEVETSMEEVDLGLQQTNFIYDLKYYTSLSPAMELIFGVQGFYLQNKNFTDALEILIPDASKDDRSVYALFNVSKSKWTAQGGLRYDYREVVASARGDHFEEHDFILPGNPENRQLTRSFDGLTASGGLTFKPTDHWRFRLNVASGFRAPDLAELFSNGNHPGTSRFEMGNAEFQREQNLQTDLGIRYQQTDWSLSAEVFHNTINNYLYFTPTDETRGELTVWRYEQDNARLYGGEAYLQIHPVEARWITAGTSFSTVTGKRRADQSYLPYIPANRWNQDITLKHSSMLGAIEKPYISLNGSWVANQFREAPLEAPTPGYFLLGMNIGGSFYWGSQKIDAFISGTNLLNKSYLDHLSLYRAFDVRQTGRNIALNLKWRF